MRIKGLSRKYGIEIKRIRLDNSGENRSLQKECDKQNLHVIFEFTAPGIVVAKHEGKKMRSKLDNRGKTYILLDMQMTILEMYTGLEY